MLADHCSELADLAELVVDENKHALRLVASKKELTEKEVQLLASSFAAGIAQIAMLRQPLILEALRLETPARAV